MNSTWALIIILSFITFINRYTFFSKFVKYHPGKELREFLNFFLQAILTALWVPIVFKPEFDGILCPQFYEVFHRQRQIFAGLTS